MGRIARREAAVGLERTHVYEAATFILRTLSVEKFFERTCEEPHRSDVQEPAQARAEPFAAADRFLLQLSLPNAQQLHDQRQLQEHSRQATVQNARREEQQIGQARLHFVQELTSSRVNVREDTHIKLFKRNAPLK